MSVGPFGGSLIAIQNSAKIEVQAQIAKQIGC